MVALMRECIKTPCRGSDFGSSDLIHVVDATSPCKGMSPRERMVKFDDILALPASITRKRKGSSRRQTPRKALSQMDENARPQTADTTIKHPRTKAHSMPDSERLLATKLSNLEAELQAKDEQLKRMNDLINFLSTEVKIYTQFFENRDSEQQEEIQRLRQTLQN